MVRRPGEEFAPQSILVMGKKQHTTTRRGETARTLLVTFGGIELTAIISNDRSGHIICRWQEINESTMRIALLHTADVHVAIFDEVFHDIDNEVHLDHRVDASLLDRARHDGIESVRADVSSVLHELSSADAVLCTCSTLGPLADDVARSVENVVRIDRPLMTQACANGSRILVALCLESTRVATLNLLNDCAARIHKEIEPVVVVCSDAWAFFEAGNTEAYASSIARCIKEKLAESPGVESIVLVQASMRVAEAELTKFGIPVHSSPVWAAQHCVDVARAKTASVA